ncbi:MAG: hypothetical protein QOK14_628, partial [Frankiaceae bacterium]|nr:hypothetical protein [Frankiaceae bacterium]
MTAPATDAPHVGLLTAVFRGVAESLGWTPGQAWTVAVGFLVAVPAALFGLGPTLATLRDAAPATTAPAAAAAAAPAPTQPPAILASAPGPAGAPLPGRSSGGGSGGAINTTPSGNTSSGSVTTGPLATVDEGVLATIEGSGSVRSIAVAADAVAIAVDAGAGAPGRVVVLDGDGAIASDIPLVVNGVPYQQPGGVAVTEGGVLVTTTSPAAVLRVDPVAGTVTKVADLPDVPLCLPVVRSEGCQVAVPDSAPRPQHLATATSGEIFVADRGQACLLRIAPGKTVAEPWLCDLSFAALPAATDGGLAGLAVVGDRVLFTVAAAVDGTD